MLIAIGAGTAFVFSFVAVLMPGLFPHTMQTSRHALQGTHRQAARRRRETVRGRFCQIAKEPV
ncbi:MAG: hypothetical protein AAB676_16995 [Verrucomicrobiota bacterium]